MAYRPDPDLEFLGKCSDHELNDLVNCLIYDKNGKPRLTEELTMSSTYKKYSPRHSHYWQEIGAEIQCFGANSIVTMFRGGKGVPYKEVLCDVCDKFKVKYDKKSNTIEIEQALFLKVLADSIEQLSPEERRAFAAELGGIDLNDLTPQSLTIALQTAFRLGGFKSYKISLIVVNAVVKALFGKGLTIAANRTLVKTLSILTGPIGWTISGVWTAIDIASPAMRVTIPAVFEIALLRQRIMAKGTSDYALIEQLY